MPKHTSRLLCQSALIAVLSAGIVAIGSAQIQIGSRQLPDSLPTAVMQSITLGRPDAGKVLHLAIAFQPSERVAFQAFADSVSDPRSPNYRQFATPEQVGECFGAAQDDVDRVVAFAKASGMTVNYISPDHLAILADCTVAQAEKAFKTQIEMFQGTNPSGEPENFRANATPLSVPASIAGVILTVQGVDDYARRVPRTTLTPALARGLYQTAASYAAGFTGAGCSLGISNWDGFKLSNAADFIAHFNLPIPGGGATSNIHVVSVSGSNNNQTGAAEGDLDIQMELSAAPLADIYIYDSTSNNLLLTVTKEAGDNKADIISESYGWSGLNASGYQAVHDQHTAMTSHGQTYLCASGDSGTADMSNDPYPDVDPDVTNVGGTIATVNTTTGARISEVGWDGSGGGWSTRSFGTTNFNILPSWQNGNGVPTNLNFRLVPDVALHSQSGSNAAFEFYYESILATVAGTSCASPWFASGLATLEQRLVANGQTRRMGRINDLIYIENGRSDVWYDVTTGNNGMLPDGSSGVGKVGWDFVTGFGAPNFDGWYTALAVQTIAPASYSLFRGLTVSGNVGSLASQDGNLLVLTPGPTFISTENPIQMILSGTSRFATPAKLEFDITLSGAADTQEEIDAYDWTTSTYKVVDVRPTPTSSTTVSVVLPTPAQFVHSGTGAVQMRVMYKALGPTLQSAWQSKIDQAVWKSTPKP